MSNTNTVRLIMTVALLLASGLLFNGCIKDSYEDCPRPFRLFIKAIDADQNDITASGEVKQAILFVFNEDQKIVDAITLNGPSIAGREPVKIALDHPGHQSLTFVAWGNIDGRVDFPATSSVKELSDLYVKLKIASGAKAASPIASSPGDLFHGAHAVPVEFGGFEPSGDQTVVIARKTSQVIITAYGLKPWNGGKEGAYTYLLRESHGGHDKDGNLTGDMVAYQPSVSMDEEGNLRAPIFHALPTTDGKSYTLEIYYNDTVIYSADKDSEGQPFVPQPGRLLNIIIDFRAQINVKMVVTPWNQVFQYVEI